MTLETLSYGIELEISYDDVLGRKSTQEVFDELIRCSKNSKYLGDASVSLEFKHDLDGKKNTRHYDFYNTFRIKTSILIRLTVDVDQTKLFPYYNYTNMMILDDLNEGLRRSDSFLEIWKSKFFQGVEYKW